VNAAGQLGVAPSSANFKHEIHPTDKESEAILVPKPVSFCYDQDIDERTEQSKSNRRKLMFSKRSCKSKVR